MAKVAFRPLSGMAAALALLSVLLLTRAQESRAVSQLQHLPVAQESGLAQPRVRLRVDGVVVPWAHIPAAPSAVAGVRWEVAPQG